ncbi:MAG: response regulator, partial [Cloacibacillus sp.]
TVKDTGIGISEEFLPKVFLPFEQEDSTNDDGRMGTGLGLSIVKNIVERMDGEVYVRSKKGEGTTFVVEWTLDSVPQEEYAPKEDPKAGVQGDINGRRVLLCEDHPLNRAIAAKLLEKKGVVVEFAENGKIAVEKFTSRPAGYYDAILMDIRMPVMDGLEAAQAIRAQERHDSQTVPIIAITANAFEEDRRKSIACGMNAHLAKPIEPQKLYETLARLLG